ncbi:hypothetical protein RchiOBHm_Chr1g0346541 [Rosa chinensis]|uniref:Uncharacterized protein n=1 Tax=Rosa chinensis TaxID=74649 RepID=A0A2P6SF30_ROSCH|nr:hypothetical protein RchiOBHm_Chr1g0346541 [Rosa chinensis]
MLAALYLSFILVNYIKVAGGEVADAAMGRNMKRFMFFMLYFI